jgi:hypothetical protein
MVLVALPWKWRLAVPGAGNLTRRPTGRHAPLRHISAAATANATLLAAAAPRELSDGAFDLLDAQNVHDVHAVDARWDEQKRFTGRRFAPERPREQDNPASPLPDSKRATPGT